MIETNQLISGSVYRHLFRLGIPMIVGFFFITSYNFIDRIFVSRLGDIATAAIGMAFLVQLVIIALGSGIGIGINSYVSRNLGAGKKDVAIDAALHAFLLAIVIGVVFATLGLLIQRPLFIFLGAEGLLLQLITDYLTIIFLFAPLTLLSMFSSGIFQGWGNTILPMIFMVIGTVLNIVFDPLLIFGLGPFPELGIIVAALASGTGRSIALIITLFVLFGLKRPAHLLLTKFKFSWQIITGIFQVGIPSSLSQILSSIAMAFIFYILKPYGSDAKAAYTIIFTYEIVVFLPAIGISQAITIMTGHNFGAGLPARIKEIYNKGITLSFSMMAITSIIIMAKPEMFAAVFAQSKEVLQITSDALRITSVGFIFISIYLCSIASFQGLGLGKQYLMATVFRMIVLQIPFAFVGSLLLGLTGVWLGLMAVNVCSSFILFGWFVYLYHKKILTGQIQPL
jgi:putative MATE family efflux protein